MTSIRRPILSRATTLLLLTALANSVSPAFAQEQAAPSEASLYFSNGVDLLQQTPPNYQDAYHQFQIAFEKSNRSWKVLGNLGLCAVNLERDGEAILYYTEYLEKGGAEIDESERKGIEKDLLLLRGNLAKLAVDSAGNDGAPVTVTVRREGSSAPAQVYKLGAPTGDLSIRAGSHHITAESGGKKTSFDVVLSPGETLTHTFDFAEPKATAAAQGSAATPADAGPQTQLSTLAWVGIGTGAAGLLTLGGGLVVGSLAKSKESTALEGCRGEGDARVCPTSAETEIDSAASMASTANILLIAGGALAATGVVLFFVGGEETVGASSAHLRFAPVPLVGGGGLVASGRF